ncbi:hypothetical protein PFAG_02406 [Plasmodium falciparum Santa Lucia]|uniref:Uncharacterized protein n=1 Tax=Plasmodium falciparum Santa Lucia TaxID=478859 RepID=W7FZE1_PLAFA|nr:hypothetical protein PFAG_02406 [Plasmodium falciparum Santa Lucia]
MITHQFNNKEILKIKHFFSILNGPVDYTEGDIEKKEETEKSGGTNQKDVQGGHNVKFEQNEQDDNNNNIYAKYCFVNMNIVINIT